MFLSTFISAHMEAHYVNTEIMCVRARVCVKQLSHVFFISLTNRANIEVNMHVFMQPLTHLSIRMCVTEETL